MPTEMLTRERPASPPPVPEATEEAGAVGRAAAHARRVRRAELTVVAWFVGSVLVTALWVLHEWQANGAFERFAHEGNPGEWNPTLWALAVGLSGLVVGIVALRAAIRRPAPSAHLERVRRLEFHVAAWVLGLVVLTPLWALIEWQDNGGFERWSANSRPGDWDPWILTVGGIWAFVVALYALWVYARRPSGRA